MKCLLCKDAVMEPAATTYMTACDNCYIIIKNVPCFRCRQCGEEYINGVTFQKIEEIIEKVKGLLTEIAVVDFRSAA